MIKKRTTFEMEIDVHFMNESAEHIAYAFHHTFDEWVKASDEDSKAWGRFIEGFGIFMLQDDGSYILKGDPIEIGDIVAAYEMELDATSTFTL